LNAKENALEYREHCVAHDYSLLRMMAALYKSSANIHLLSTSLTHGDEIFQSRGRYHSERAAFI